MGRLCQGVGVGKNVKGQRVSSTNTFHAILFDDIPQDRRKEITYISFVCEVCQQKENPNRTRITIEGNQICYTGVTGNNTKSLELLNLLITSVLSLKDYKFSSFNVKNFCFGTPIDRPEYVKIKLSDIP